MDAMTKAVCVWALLLLLSALHPFVKAWFPYPGERR